MALGTADYKLARFFTLFGSRIVLRLVMLHCRHRPGHTDSHDLHGESIGEIRGYSGHARGFLWPDEERDSALIENHLQFERVAHAIYVAEIDQFAFFVVR